VSSAGSIYIPPAFHSLHLGVWSQATSAAIMDDYMFRLHLDECREVSESTAYVEMLNYSVRRSAHSVCLIGQLLMLLGC
jgi:hypothetical protein